MQAGRMWSQSLHTRITVAGFVQCVADMCLYHKKDGVGIVVVGIYVDDLLATGTSAEVGDRFFISIKNLSIEDLGRLPKFVGHARRP